MRCECSMPLMLWKVITIDTSVFFETFWNLLIADRRFSRMLASRRNGDFT